MERVLEYVAGLSEEDIPRLLLEEAACCEAWLEAQQGHPADKERYHRVVGVIESWTRLDELPNTETEGRHQQPLLRQLIDVVQHSGISGLSDDEVHFLHAILNLFSRIRNLRAFARPIDLLKPFEEGLRVRHSRTPFRPGLPSLAGRVRFVTDADLKAAKSRELKIMAGIEVGCVAPVFVHSGDLKVLGSVPEKCVVVVEGGSLYVSGYVLGRVAATQHCEVYENISGMVVVRQGSIRTRNVVDGAFLVSKSGDVACRRMQNPRLVYAAGRITVKEDVTQGRYAAARMAVHGTVRSGELNVYEHVEAHSFRPDPGRLLVVALRNEITGREYGEVMTPEAHQLVVRIGTWRARTRQLTLAVEHAEREADDAALNALLYLCGGEEARSRVEALEAKQRRLMHLRLIIQGLQEVSDRTGIREEDMAVFSLLQDGLNDFDTEETVDNDLRDEHREILKTWESLLAKERDTGITSNLLSRLRDRLADWIREQSHLVQQIAVMEGDLRAVLESLSIVKQAVGHRSKMQLLRRFIGAARGGGAGEAVARRVDSAFVRLMIRTIDGRLERAEHYRATLEQQRKKLREMIETLRSDHQISVRDEQEGQPSEVRATGRFAPNVRIMAEPMLGNEVQARWPLLLSRDSGDHVRTYARTEQGIVEREGPAVEVAV